MTARRPVPGINVPEILAFEVMSSTEWATPGLAPFIPKAYVDISDYLPKKPEALTAYNLECVQCRTREVLHTLRRWRGIEEIVGLEAAEAFEIIKFIL